MCKDKTTRMYKYAKWASGYEGAVFDEDAIIQHDIRLGAFIRAFAIAEFFMKQITCQIYKGEPSLIGFMMSKLGAGQSGAMFKDTIKAHTDGEVRKTGLAAAGQFMELNNFRNEIAHGSHMFNGKTPVLVKWKAESIGGKIHSTELTEQLMDEKITAVYTVIETLAGVYGKINGIEGPIEDIIKRARAGSSPAWRSHT